MMIENLTTRMLHIGFQEVKLSMKGVQLFYGMNGDTLYAVSFVQLSTGEEYSLTQYQYILSQFKSYLEKQYSKTPILLSIIFTNQVEKARTFCVDVDMDHHWVVDMEDRRLIIYENQRANFPGIGELIEQELMSDGWNAYGPSYDDIESQGRKHGSRVRFLTLCNTLIILVNVVGYLVYHHSGWFGGHEEMRVQGALSWFHIKNYQEYYRILTSMFMHGGLEHLFNNMLILFFVGDNLEKAVGKVRYLFIYFGSGIIAALTSISYNMRKEALVFSVGASGAIFGVVGSMLYILIRNKGRLEDISLRQIILFAIVSLYGGFANARIDNAAHIGGFFGGLIIAVIVYHKGKRSRDTVGEKSL